ncbi:MAG: GtrA family protein [Saprospiraceae bacterium]|jgi:putative flippase GtrA|nr:GtrA family protein [Saprospiraceae bacterium]
MDFIRFFKFGLVGSFGILIDFSITWLCKEKLKWNQYYANALGFCFAASGNYILNKTFTFNNHDHAILRQYTTFLFISIVGLVLNSILLVLVQKRTNLDFYFSKILVTGLLFIWNFAANSHYTFR